MLPKSETIIRLREKANEYDMVVSGECLPLSGEHAILYFCSFGNERRL